MKKNDAHGDRMKKYESVHKTVLMRRTPVIIRLDGKSFHSFTKGFKRPFDDVLIKTMQETTLYLCQNIQGCVFGYTQSDEITLVLCDYQKINTSAWFDYEVQKLCSVTASMATMKFNQLFYWNAEHFVHPAKMSDIAGFGETEESKKIWEQYKTYTDALSKGAMFDARCFNVPKEEVTNCIVWRQKDCTRNSVQMVGQKYFSHNQLQNKKENEIQDMLHEIVGVNWNDFPTYQKRGTAVIRVGETMWDEKLGCYNTRMYWKIDEDMPIISKNRDYVESLINFN